jgi:DNA-binding MarR family transcriptional regulator
MPTPPASSNLPCACSGLRKAARSVSRIYEILLGTAGMTATQFAILRMLQRSGPLPLSRLAEALVLERTSLYRTLQPLRDDGLVEFRDGPDRRIKVGALTKSGRQAIRRALPQWETAQQGFVQRFGRRRWAALSKELEAVLETMQEMEIEG